MFYYKQVKDGNIVSVEAKTLSATSPNFVKATKAEYDDFIASLPVVEPEPVRDLEAEIDELKAKTLPIFTPPPGTGIPEKVEYIEQYLKELQGR